MSNDSGLIQGRLTDESINLMRERIGYPNPTLRGGVINNRPWVSTATADTIRHFAIGIGDGNPLYNDPDYAANTRWGGPIAHPGFEMAMGWNKSAVMDEKRAAVTSKALRGVHLFYSGHDAYYWRPITAGVTLYKSEWVDNVEVKESEFAGRSAIVKNGLCYWDQIDVVTVTGSNWFVHAERKKSSSISKNTKYDPAIYTDEQLAEIEAAYDNEYVRGPDTLYLEDVHEGQALPRMVKGPLTVTDLMNLHIGAGWLTYGNPPFRLAYENRKRLRGFYSKNEFNAWDTIQRVHWDAALAHAVGVNGTYDIGPLRDFMLSHYCTNFAGDDGFVHYLRSEYRNFNFMGDTTWITGVITSARVDDRLGPLIELSVKGENQRGQENIRGSAIILVSSRKHGPVKLPEPPPITPHRSV